MFDISAFPEDKKLQTRCFNTPLEIINLRINITPIIWVKIIYPDLASSRILQNQE